MTRHSVEAIIASLESAGVRYLIVGGLAVVAHGYVRFTADIDLVLAPDGDNLLRAVTALEDQGYRPRAPVPFGAFLDAGERARWQNEKSMVVFSASSPRHPATQVDLFLEAPFEFEGAWQRSVAMEISPQLHARFIALSDLRAMKRAAGRPMDLLDLDALARVHPEETP